MTSSDLGVPGNGVVKPLRKVRTPSAIALGLGGRGPRIPLAFPTLNRATRGGTPSGKIVTIVGGPGTGKSGVLYQQLWEHALEGHVVALYAADSDADDAVIRIGQREGLDRSELENGVQGTTRRLAAILEAVPNFAIYDIADEHTIESVADALHRSRIEGKATILGIDSIQTAASRAARGADLTRKEVVDANIKAVKFAARKYGHLVVDTSESGRRSYSGRAGDDLSAGKDSGSIEFASDILLVMRSVRGDDGLVQVTMPKNRLGRKMTFRLQLDARAATFVEVGEPIAAEAKADGVREAVLAALRSHTDLKSANAVCKAAAVNRAAGLEAIGALLKTGVVIKVDGFLRIAEGAAA